MAKIGLDLDGVVCDFHTEWLKEINRVQGTNLILDDITEYEFTKSGLTKEELWNIIKRQAACEVFKFLKPIEGAIEGARKLAEKNTLHILTHRLGRAKEDAVYWLNHHKIPFESISFTKNKGRVSYLLGLDIAIEDTFKNSIDLANYGIETLLLDRPYNRQTIETPLIQRVYNWKEIVDIIN